MADGDDIIRDWIVLETKGFQDRSGEGILRVGAAAGATTSSGGAAERPRQGTIQEVGRIAAGAIAAPIF